ncbi:PKD domain-containing protein, partial [Escherichia coli]|uniref:PKD domain-containing protein n=1 Tax=Escherichia coli TaxID=562 RepID=UPI00128F0C25
DPDGYIERCIWDFGDGNVATECNVTHSYEKPGNYSVSLTVFDSQGLSDTKKRLWRWCLLDLDFDRLSLCEEDDLCYWNVFNVAFKLKSSVEK